MISLKMMLILSLFLTILVSSSSHLLRASSTRFSELASPSYQSNDNKDQYSIANSPEDYRHLSHNESCSDQQWFNSSSHDCVDCPCSTKGICSYSASEGFMCECTNALYYGKKSSLISSCCFIR